MIDTNKCKWKYGKQAPVVIMMDDLCNKYMTDRSDGGYLGADWGGMCDAENSWYQFVKHNIFDKYPYVRMTCFLVTGRREDLIIDGKSNISLAMDETEQFREFIKKLSKDEHIELAYHGYTHGHCSKDNNPDGFIQEWDTFVSVEDAVDVIAKGKKLYEDIVGESFKGGKYCGYRRNAFSDESIVRSGFLYWCRHWDNVQNGINGESLDMEMFDGVVDIPSSVDGNLFSLREWKHLFTREYVKAMYRKLRYNVTLEKTLDGLVKNGQVISIQSHTSPIREDNKRQYPNVIDDIDNIIYILEYLKK